MRPFWFLLVAVAFVGCVPQDAFALDCSGGSCRAGAFTPIARAPIAIGKGIAKVARHRIEKRQDGELPRQKAAKAISSARPLRKVGKAVRWLVVGGRGG